MAEPLAWLYYLLVVGPYVVFPVVLARRDGRRGGRLVGIGWWLGVPVWLTLVALIVTPPTARAIAVCAWLYLFALAANWLVVRIWWHRDRGKAVEWRWALAYWLGSLVHAGLIVPSLPYGPAGRDVIGCQANLRTIGVALQSYAGLQGCLPLPATRTPDGEAGTSWRTAILPYLGQEAVYNSFNQDRPWSSPANSTAARTVLTAYLCPAQYEPSRSPVKYDLLLSGPRRRARRADGYALTHYTAVTGPIGALRQDEPVRLQRLVGAQGAACLAGEVYLRDWPWAAPDDVRWTGTDHPPYSVLGFDSAHENVLLFLLADGSVHAVARDIDPDLLRRMLTSHLTQPDPDDY